MRHAGRSVPQSLRIDESVPVPLLEFHVVLSQLIQIVIEPCRDPHPDFPDFFDRVIGRRPGLIHSVIH
jgi:hypothetical protein